MGLLLDGSSFNTTLILCMSITGFFRVPYTKGTNGTQLLRLRCPSVFLSVGFISNFQRICTSITGITTNNPNIFNLLLHLSIQIDVSLLQ